MCNLKIILSTMLAITLQVNTSADAAQKTLSAKAETLEETDKRARKRRFDDRGVLLCSQERGEEPGECAFGVARSVGGTATVVVTFANSFSRRLYFRDGAFVSANTTMSGTGKDTDWRVEDGIHLIRVDDQRYRVPDTIIVVPTEGDVQEQ